MRGGRGKVGQYYGRTMAGLWQDHGRAAAHAFLNPESPDQTFTYAQSSSYAQSHHHYLHGHRHQYHFKVPPLEIATNVMTQRPRKVVVMQAFQNKRSCDIYATINARCPRYFVPRHSLLQIERMPFGREGRKKGPEISHRKLREEEKYYCL